VSDDLHTPTTAGPTPAGDPGPQPTTTVPLSEADGTTPPGTAWPGGMSLPATDKPEVLVGAAFAGGFLAAMILKRLGR
jgi:hypothetical protein